MKTLFLITFASLFVAAGANAEGGCSSKPDPVSVVQNIFEKADRDGDGLLTQAEYEGAGLQNFGVSFAASDTNSDGTTSLEEYVELYEQHHPPVEDIET